MSNLCAASNWSMLKVLVVQDLETLPMILAKLRIILLALLGASAWPPFFGIVGMLILLPIAAVFACSPPIEFTASPAEVASGDPVVLRWLSPAATSCTASGDWSGTKSTSGTEIIKNVTVDKSFMLSCSNEPTVVTAKVKVASTQPIPDPVLLSASPPIIEPGGTFTAIFSGVDKASLHDWIGVYSIGAPDKPTGKIPWKFTSTCTQASGNAAAVASGSCPFTIAQPGAYELRLFTNNTFDKFASSGPITVKGTIPPDPPPTTGKKLVVGLGVQQHSGTFDAAGQAFVKELGTHSIRVGWGHGDHMYAINWAAQNGIGVSFFTGYGGNCDVRTPAGRQCYADRTAAIAKSHGAKIQYYEVWNEWNGGIGLGCRWNQPGTMCVNYAAYTDLLCRTSKAVKAVQPKAVIVGGGTAGTDMNFISKMLDNGAANCMDAVSVHPYVYGLRVPYNSPTQIAVDRFVLEVNGLQVMLKQRTGKTFPILITEEGRKSPVGQEHVTAHYLSAVYSRARTLPYIAGIWWFALEDPTNDASATSYGLVRSNNTRKVPFAAFKAEAAK